MRPAPVTPAPPSPPPAVRPVTRAAPRSGPSAGPTADFATNLGPRILVGAGGLAVEPSRHQDPWWPLWWEPWLSLRQFSRVAGFRAMRISVTQFDCRSVHLLLEAAPLPSPTLN